MKMYDYMSSGKCILATDMPIHHEVLNKENAYFFEPTPEKLAEAILYLKDNPNICTKLGKQAKLDFESKYSFDVMKEKYKQLFEDLYVRD